MIGQLRATLGKQYTLPCWHSPSSQRPKTPSGTESLCGFAILPLVAQLFWRARVSNLYFWRRDFLTVGVLVPAVALEQSIRVRVNGALASLSFDPSIHCKRIRTGGCSPIVVFQETLPTFQEAALILKVPEIKNEPVTLVVRRR
ncbi:hypothetical protein TcCL_NonESM10543, partial [Trypanosoma cruzi]